jgi:hypothetical protein
MDAGLTQPGVKVAELCRALIRQMHYVRKLMKDCLSEVAADPLIAAILTATSLMAAIVLLSMFAI